jgi:two-component system phosphate regulon sensor histidine kinase PhoR
MPSWALRVLYYVLLPAIFIAAAILGYYTYLTASKLDTLGTASITQSTLLLLQEKVDRVESRIIDADNAVFHVIDVANLDVFESTWPALAERISPTVRAVYVLDAGGGILSSAARMPDTERRELDTLFVTTVLADLELPSLEVDLLRHLHRSYFGRSYLFSFKAIAYDDERYYVVAYHDTSAIIRDEFSALFSGEESRRIYNVLDEDGRRVFGPSLSSSGEFLVSRRFPTTLYAWRLQVAPELAPALVTTGRSRRVTEVSLIGLSFAIVILGSVFLLYAASKERRLNALKSEFIANVSHELKTPLSVIRMFGEMLLTGRVRSEEKRNQYVEMICRESERLTALIENVLDFAALERGKAVYQMRIANVADVASRALDAFRYRAEQDKTEIRVESDADLPLAAFDEQAILLAIVNLLDNAVKYGEGTPVEVIVTSKNRDIELRVRDHGPGIPRDDMKRIFERFYRANRGAPQRGSGIGLSLVKQIAEAHGGRAWAENAPGGGAIVGLSIPALTRRERFDTQETAV